MRSFNNFLREATETSASRQAKLLGLVGDGHGGWYDAKGKFVAKTEQGKLKFYGLGGAKPKKLRRVRVLFLYLVDSIHLQSDIKNFYNLLKEKQKELMQI